VVAAAESATSAGPGCELAWLPGWPEQEFLSHTAAAGADPVGVGAALDALLGRGRDICLEIGCGTGAI
jgi:hypothetical protein